MLLRRRKEALSKVKLYIDNNIHNRPNTTFKKGKYATVDSLCYAQFLSNYNLDNKKRTEEENDYQPVILNDEFLTSATEGNENNNLPNSISLMNGKEYMNLRETKCVLRYHVPSKLKKPESYAYHLLFMFFPFRSESELNATPNKLYTE